MAVHFSQALSSTFWVNTAVDRMMKVLSQDSWSSEQQGHQTNPPVRDGGVIVERRGCVTPEEGGQRRCHRIGGLRTRPWKGVRRQRVQADMQPELNRELGA